MYFPCVAVKDKITFFWYDLRGELLVNYTDVIDFLFEEEEDGKLIGYQR